VPSQHHYFKKFNELDETDFKIISEMTRDCPEGPRNVRRIAAKLSLPQQTVNYRVLRLEQKNLVRFRATVNESVLGLSNYVVMVTVKPGLLHENKEGTATNSGTFLTCFPVWRLLKEVHGGSSHGFFVQYSIPTEKEEDLRSFLGTLQEIGCIEKVNYFYSVTSRFSTKPSLELYKKIRKEVAQGRKVSFNWENWVDGFDYAKEAVLTEEVPPKRKYEFSYEHLLTLFHLERNLREKFVSIAKSTGESSAKVRGWFKDVCKHNLIADCRVELYPTDPQISANLVLKLEFNKSSDLGRFISHLDQMPYPTTYQKVLQKNVVFVHTIIPSHEYFDFHNAFETLSRRHDVFSEFDQYVSTYYSRSDNIKLFETYSRKDKVWLFSFDVMRRFLKKKLDDTRFEF